MLRLLVGPGVAPAGAQSIAPWELSDKIQVSDQLHGEVGRMLRSSATFRSQYRRIAQARSILVGVRVDPTLIITNMKARSLVRRYDSGLIVVAVSIGPGPSQGEWIAHEFEHVLEQLEGLNLRALVRNRLAHVWFSGEGAMETARAVRAGQAVREELRHGISGSDNFVE
jgi:hypothetical protein